MGEERCDKCMFSRRGKTLHLYCHKAPPVHTAEGDFRFPDVRDEDWCGEYQAEFPPDLTDTNEEEA